MVCAIEPSSLCAGISTVTVTGPAYRPRVALITTLGASGLLERSAERRDRSLIRRSRSARPAANSTASAVAASIVRPLGAAVS